MCIVACIDASFSGQFSSRMQPRDGKYTVCGSMNRPWGAQDDPSLACALNCILLCSFIRARVFTGDSDSLKHGSFWALMHPDESARLENSAGESARNFSPRIRLIWRIEFINIICAVWRRISFFPRQVKIFRRFWKVPLQISHRVYKFNNRVFFLTK